MDFGFTPEDEDFRTRSRAWLDEHLSGDYAAAAGQGGPGSAHEAAAVRRRWERALGRAGWIGIGWDRSRGSHGNRAATLTQQVVWAEEYARAGAPGRVGHIGENLLAPTLLAHGTDEQCDRFLPPIARGEELWCQGYSEPGAGSDLTAVRTTAVRDSAADGGAGGYRVTGQKIWTSLAREADWCFVLARTGPGTRGRHGLSFLLVPMDQPGRVQVRPIRQMSGTDEFNEVFFDGARVAPGHRVGAEGDGWRIATSLLALERGVSTLAQQIGFAAELDRVLRLALQTGADTDPVVRDRLVRAWAELRTMRWNALRTLGGSGSGSGSGSASGTGSGSETSSGSGSGTGPGTETGPGSVPGSGNGSGAGSASGSGAGPGAHAGTVPGAPSVAKLLWGSWHQRLGELAMQVRQAAAALGPHDWSPHRPYELDPLQRLFLFSRADTLYGGSDEIQRDILARHVLGLPGEART
ncbi:acyl-CoA dehydrogenase family protein [Streptomyces qinglanensis]|uniref:Acyl-CoA dehydrogenase n=1 Tax=Streptomyces qinglanensis TaxID=943816 RepID=A0A1H9W0N9_9ACTN|nr:acyl-CoA dehydrogenase family protein [Streptomyces qinglanensis]SES27311.1 Acyl-CoA dehydrogenase [Streptomyces qinglanensis]